MDIAKETMEKILVDRAEYEYPEIICTIKFAGHNYKMGVNYAYLNYCLDEIFTKYKVPFDESWMWVKALTAKTSKDEITKISRRLYELQFDKLVADKLMLEVVDLTSKIINLVDSGKRVSLDLSLVGLANDVLTKPEVHDLLMIDHIHDDMLPEDIIKKKEEILNQLKTYDIYGIRELLRSGSGVKADQVFNCIIGLWLRTRIQDMNDVAPYILHERWIDGLKTRKSLFIELNNNRMAAIATKDVIRDAGTQNKHAGTLSQDMYINGVDCGSIHGLKYFVRDENDLFNIEFKYQIMPDGSLREISMKDTHLIGTTVNVRSAFKCNNKEGICEHCFGAHARWNKSTKEYRRDLGSEFTKVYISDASQEVLSFKHTVTPDVIPIRFDIVNQSTGELTHNWEDFVDRSFTRITPKKGISAYFYTEDVANRKRDGYKSNYPSGDIIYQDGEYDDKDIIRVSQIYQFKDGVEYIVQMSATITKTNTKERQVPFKVTGFMGFNHNNYSKGEAIKITEDHKIIQIIPNRSKTSRFHSIKALYASESENIKNHNGKDKKNTNTYKTIEDMVVRVKEVLPDAHLSAIEVIFRNKVKSIDNTRVVPDWSKPDAEERYVILSEIKAINALTSISAKLGLGYFNNRLKKSYYYDADNITPSAYDLLYDSFDEIIAREQYEDADIVDYDGVDLGPGIVD